METPDRLSEVRQLGATARSRGRPIFENPYRVKYADAWRKGWQGASAAADRPLFQTGSFAAELYDYLVRHDRDDGLTVHEITDGLVERSVAKVGNGLSHLYKRGHCQVEGVRGTLR